MWGANTKVVAVNREGEILCQKSIPTETEKGPEATAGRIISLINSLTRSQKLSWRMLCAAGAAAAGIVDMKEGVCKHLTNFPGNWDNFPLAAKIQENIGCQTFLLNDVRAMSLGEIKFGVGRGIKNLICIAVGTGIANLVLILNPEMIILGGGIAGATDLMMGG